MTISSFCGPGLSKWQEPTLGMGFLSWVGWGDGMGMAKPSVPAKPAEKSESPKSPD